MPFVQLTPQGDVEALFLKKGSDRPYLPLSDIRVLHFLQASDPELTAALLNASDDAHRMLLSSLIDLLVRNKTLSGKTVVTDHGQLIPHKQLDELIETVETSEDEALLTLTESDRNTVRIIEDVIDVLIALDVISLRDLPPGAQHLLAVRRALRAYLSDHDGDLD
ncbi:MULTISPECIES: hypothetical protein [unclassified Paludibacterium]|uniref:hypothetical protein n=1 Tax=unclassified Paludibacterium TaxID=2618429 RepID=UPI001C03C46B|nr:hypothetical protein [Paludibacterium sp. B53371]BEV72931.1 hypothetical protein THUN1379_24130 [Paludibacterium sp. THUN1379]